MGFTLTDPRLNAVSQGAQGFGQGFGQGIGNQLTRFIENQRIQQALKGASPNEGINQTLQRLSQANVSPEFLNTYLSPTVQQRLGQERAQGVYQQLGQLSPEQLSNIPAPQLLSYLLSATANLPEGSKAVGPIIETLQKYAQTQNFQKGGGLESVYNTPKAGFQVGVTQPAANGNLPARGTINPQTAAQNQRNINSAATRSGFLPEPGEVPGIGEYQFNPDVSDVYQGVNNLLKLSPGLSLQDAIDQYSKVQGISNDRIQQLYKSQEQVEATREKQVAEANRVTDVARTKLSNEYGTDASGKVNLPNGLENLAIDLMKEDKKGTDEQRFARSNKVITDILDRTRNLTTGETRPFAGGLRKEKQEAFIRKKQGQAKAILDDPRIPESYKPVIREQLRTALTQVKRPTSALAAFGGIAGSKASNYVDAKMFGPVEVESIINPPSKMLDAEITRVKSPKELDNLWYRLGPMDSPLYITQKLIDKGYSQDEIVDSYDRAVENGANLSPYQQTQRGELNTPMVPNLSTIFGTDPSTRGLWDIVSGRK